MNATELLAELRPPLERHPRRRRDAGAHPARRPRAAAPAQASPGAPAGGGRRDRDRRHRRLRARAVGLQRAGRARGRGRRAHRAGRTAALQGHDHAPAEPRHRARRDVADAGWPALAHALQRHRGQLRPARAQVRGLPAQARRGAGPHDAGDVQGQARPVGLARDLEPELRRRPARRSSRRRCAATTRRCATSAARRSAGSTSTRSASSAKRRSPTRPPAPRSRSCATRR